MSLKRRDQRMTMKEWIAKTTSGGILLIIIGYAIVWLTGYLFTGIKEAGPPHPAQIGVVVFGGIIAAIPIMMYGAVVVGFIVGSASTFFDSMKTTKDEK